MAHSLRSGGATCLYHAGVDLEYIRRVGRWKSSTFAIYFHFGDKIPMSLSSRLVRSEGPTAQLKACTGGNQRAVFEKGDVIGRCFDHKGRMGRCVMVSRPHQTKRKRLEVEVGASMHGGRPMSPKRREFATITGSQVIVGLKVGPISTRGSHTIQQKLIEGGARLMRPIGLVRLTDERRCHIESGWRKWRDCREVHNPAGHAGKEKRERGVGRSSSPNGSHGLEGNRPRKVPGPKVEMSEAEYSGVSHEGELWDVVYRPEYARDEDGVDALMTQECLIYDAQGKVSVDAAYRSKNIRIAKAKSRDVRSQRTLLGEILEGATSIAAYRKDYRSYMNARRQQRAGGEMLEMEINDSLDVQGNPKERGEIEIYL